jgi:hypothetical protein
MEVSGQFHALAALTQVKSLQYPLAHYKGLGLISKSKVQ